MSLRKNGPPGKEDEELLLDLDSTESPSAAGLDNLDSPMRKQVEVQLKQLQNKLQKYIDRVKKQ